MTEQRLDLALKASNEGIWDWDVVRDRIYYSNRLLGFLGYGRIGAPNIFAEPEEHVHPDDLRDFSRKLERVLDRGGRLFAVETRFRTKEGDWKWFRVRGLPQRAADGTLLSLVGSLIDISKRKFAEEALLEERRRIDMVLDRVPINVYFKDRESRFVRANLATAERMTGGELKDLFGKTDADFFIEEDARISREEELHIMQTGVGLEESLVKKRWLDGRETWALVTKKVWRSLDGEVLGIFGLTHDVTELIEAEHDLERLVETLRVVNQEASEERSLMRLVIDHIPVFVYFKNRDSEFVLVNKGMANLVGEESPEAVLGKHDRDYFNEELVRATVRDEQEIMRTGIPLERKLEKIRWKDDHITWSVSSKYPWYGPDGSLQGTFGVSSDVTELVETREKLERLTMDLGRQNRAMEEQLGLAREVQQAAFPEWIEPIRSANGTREVVFHHRYQPASQLAGDFYEVIRLDERRVGVLVCDVMGHGIRSALIVSMLRGLIERQREHSGDRPGTFLTELNDGLSHLLERTNQIIFSSAVYGVIDLEVGELRVASAGHPDPILRREGHVAAMGLREEERGPALGMIPGFEFPEVVLPLDGISRAWFFTDGVFEVLDDEGEEFGLERMKEALSRGDDAGAAIESLLKAGEIHARGGGFGDDVCLLGFDFRFKSGAIANSLAGQT